MFGLDPQELEALELDAKNTDEITDAVWALAKDGYSERSRSSAPTCCGGSSATSCCRSSTRSGRTTSTRSII